MAEGGNHIHRVDILVLLCLQLELGSAWGVAWAAYWALSSIQSAAIVDSAHITQLILTRLHRPATRDGRVLEGGRWIGCRASFAGSSFAAAFSTVDGRPLLCLLLLRLVFVILHAVTSHSTGILLVAEFLARLVPCSFFPSPLCPSLLRAACLCLPQPRRSGVDEE